MSPGKVAAQAAHAEMLALIDYHEDPGFYEADSDSKDLYREWIDSGHYTKLVMLAEDDQQLYNIETYLCDRGYKTFPVIDEGRTEIQPFSFTAMSVQLVDKDQERIQQHFGEFRTYKEKKTVTPKKGRQRFKKRRRVP